MMDAGIENEVCRECSGRGFSAEVELGCPECGPASPGFSSLARPTGGLLRVCDNCLHEWGSEDDWKGTRLTLTPCLFCPDGERWIKDQMAGGDVPE